MSSRIAYSADSAAGKQVAEFVDSVMVTLAKGRRLTAQLNSMNYGNPADTTAVETEIGGMAAGSGADLVYIISVAMQAIDVAQVAELARIDQG